MALIFSPPLIQAQSWQEAQRKFNEIIRQLVLQFNNIYTGANIPTDRIKDDAITETKIADDAITTPMLQANIIIADKIAAGTITANKLNISQLDAISANIGTLSVGTITTGITLDASWRKVYDNTLTSNATSVTLSGLSGNTDLHYYISAKWVKNGGTTSNFGIQCNGDTGVSNYGWFTFYGPGGGLNTESYNDNDWFMLWAGRADTDGYVSHGHGYLQAESGYTRTFIGQFMREINPAGSMHSLYSMGDCWWNTAAEITSLKFLSEAATALKIGTRIEVWRRVD